MQKWLRDFTVLRGYSHNICGLKQDRKIEQLCHYISNLGFTFCCLQETWLKGDYLSQVLTSHSDKPSRCLLFHHGQPKQEGCGSGGVVTILGPEGGKAWQLAGSPDPICGDLVE
eukprot:8065060-Ditylum_brightwellii.AAC.1